MKTELEILKEKVKEIENQQRKCNHEWGEIEYDPERVEITRDERVYLGSDSYFMEVGTGKFKDKPRWTRICKKCGKKEHAHEEEKLVTGIEKRIVFR